jgi:hypothetical protein
MTDEPTHDSTVDAPKYVPLSSEVIADQSWQSLPDHWMHFPVNPEMLVLGFAAGNFSSAFLQALGERTAGGVAELSKTGMKKLIKRLSPKRVRREGQPDEYHIGLGGGATATIVVTENTPDEARLALLDLDVTAEEVRGKELRWDKAAEEWRAS